MPKKIKSFTVHLQNPKTKTEEIEKYLNKVFGPPWDDDYKNRFWYLGRNYDRPRNESHLEIKFFGEPNKKHTLMMLEHPFTIINEDADIWYECDTFFNKLFTMDWE